MCAEGRGGEARKGASPQTRPWGVGADLHAWQIDMGCAPSRRQQESEDLPCDEPTAAPAAAEPEAASESPFRDLCNQGCTLREKYRLGKTLGESPDHMVCCDGHSLVAVVSVQVRSVAASQASVHSEKLPAQSTLTHAPSPLAQLVAVGQAAPLPSCAAVSVQVLSAAASQASVHSEKEPAQSVPHPATVYWPTAASGH